MADRSTPRRSKRRKRSPQTGAKAKKRLQLLSDDDWHTLRGAPPCELRLAVTLLSGQAFLWERRCVAADGTSARAQFPGDLLEHDAASSYSYSGSVGPHLYELREREGSVEFRVLSPRSDFCAARRCLRRYLRLPSLLEELSCDSPTERGILRRGLDRGWSGIDAGFRLRADLLPGVRLLSVPLLEALVSFVGSANNNIKRNSQMLRALCAEFPENAIGELSGDHEPRFQFPSLPQLATVTEERLWELGWGYRAPRIAKLVPMLLERGGVAWLEGLRLRDWREAREALCELPGVGRKVADCIILFSLSEDSCIPVDTHCWQMMGRSGYLPQLKNKKLNAASYELIGDTLRGRFGKAAGWAFMTLFVAEVHPFRVSLERGERFGEEMWFGGSSDAARLKRARATTAGMGGAK